jgi:hypothetical protein
MHQSLLDAPPGSPSSSQNQARGHTRSQTPPYFFPEGIDHYSLQSLRTALTFRLEEIPDVVMRVVHNFLFRSPVPTDDRLLEDILDDTLFFGRKSAPNFSYLLNSRSYPRVVLEETYGRGEFIELLAPRPLLPSGSRKNIPVDRRDRMVFPQGIERAGFSKLGLRLFTEHLNQSAALLAITTSTTGKSTVLVNPYADRRIDTDALYANLTIDQENLPPFSSLISWLLEEGIPAGELQQRQVWLFNLSKGKRVPVASRHNVFTIKDRCGLVYVLKQHEDCQKSAHEQAVVDALSKEFPFIPAIITIPSVITPHPDEKDCIALFHYVDRDRDQGFDYWLARLAEFHLRGKAALETRCHIPQHRCVSLDILQQQYLRLALPALPWDETALASSISYLDSSPHPALIHGDPKRDNRHGRFLVDLEEVSLGNPTIDLSLVFMEYGIPLPDWQRHLDEYHERTGRAFPEVTLQVLKTAAMYAGVKEILGSSLRKLDDAARLNNARLSSYLRSILQEGGMISAEAAAAGNNSAG